MKKEISDVERFHIAFDAPVGNKEKPHLIPKERSDLRYSLIYEELEEYKKACEDGDLVEIADALGDILYVVFGTVVEHGLQEKIIDVFEEIQASNMSKLGADGKPIFREDGKILKGPDYFKPNIKKVLGVSGDEK